MLHYLKFTAKTTIYVLLKYYSFVNQLKIKCTLRNIYLWALCEMKNNMIPVTENVSQRRRRRSQLSETDFEYNVLADSLIDESHHNSWFWNRSDRILSQLLELAARMQRSTRIALIAFAILVCVILVILLLNLQSIKPSQDACPQPDGEKTCYVTNNKYRLYGTKTVYNIVRSNNSESFDVGECVPKIFYLLSRHATRYPDKDDIEEMIKILPVLKDQINNASHSSKAKICEEDLKILQNWNEKLKPENDNQLSDTGEQETIELAQHFKARFPSLLNQSYSPEKFQFEFTSRERTRSTAEAFIRGLFNEDSEKIVYDNSINDKVLQFHKDCKKIRGKCNDSSYDISEVDKFEEGSLMQKLIESVSRRIGVTLNYHEIKILHKACSFGFALNIGDTWCSLFSTDELKILEFGDDIDDYYKDAYGNKINYEQACPVVQYVMDLFESFINTTDSKAVMQFSHAGGVKKVISLFGLFQDDEPLKADSYCSQQNRRWRSSYISPFMANLVLVLYDCDAEKKIAAFHNEQPIKLGGCKDKFCSYKEFYETYNPIAKNCDLKSICCTCCNA